MKYNVSFVDPGYHTLGSLGHEDKSSDCGRASRHKHNLGYSEGHRYMAGKFHGLMRKEGPTVGFEMNDEVDEVESMKCALCKGEEDGGHMEEV